MKVKWLEELFLSLFSFKHDKPDYNAAVTMGHGVIEFFFIIFQTIYLFIYFQTKGHKTCTTDVIDISIQMQRNCWNGAHTFTHKSKESADEDLSPWNPMS